MKSAGRARLFVVIGLLGLLICLCAGCSAALQQRQMLMAQGAGWLRQWVGNQAVAGLEALVFQAQDGLRQRLYDWGLRQAEAPWQESLPNGAAARPTHTPQPPAAAAQPDLTAPQPTQAVSPTPAPPTPSPTPSGFWLADVEPLGSIQGEGAWEPYLFNPQRQPAGYRTFLQPDPNRPYTLVGVVAFDLQQTRLHFVLGSEEPATQALGLDGIMPYSDRRAGHLLATFNGGFLSTHGMFGAMANNLTSIAARSHLATVGIYPDGKVEIGAWDELSNPYAMIAWRQNALPMIQQGQISEQVYSNSIADWGGSLDGDIVTWRSGLCLDQPGQVLYYFAGSSLDMPNLARSMQAVGCWQGMLLDINEYWVFFAAVRENLNTEPLFPEMDFNTGRYLYPSKRDFFYVTLAETP